MVFPTIDPSTDHHLQSQVFFSLIAVALLTFIPVRHVKCDERKPSCLRCAAANRTCEGYAVLPRLIQNPYLPSLNDEERRAFLYFTTRTVYEIFGEQDGESWTALFVQVGQSEVCIKHAITALASLHESAEPVNYFVLNRRTSQQVSSATEVLALKHYNEAIRLLTQESFNTELQPDITMILCILFICFEQMRNGDAACLVHLVAGLKLLRSWRACTNNYSKLRRFSKSTSQLVNDGIAPVMQRLRVQFGLCMDHRHTWEIVGSSPCLPPPNIPFSFETLNAARISFDRTMNYVFTMMECSGASRESKLCEDLVHILKRWKIALNNSKFSKEGDSLQICTCKLLEIYYQVSVIIASTFQADCETAFDQFTSQFQFIVNLADDLISEWQARQTRYHSLFSFDIGLTPPMFMVASRCRHPIIRRKAVKLIMQTSAYRGVWRDRYSGLCAQRIIDLEEYSLIAAKGHDFPPEQLRIRKVSADLQAERNQILMHFTRSPFTKISKIHTTVIPLNT